MDERKDSNGALVVAGRGARLADSNIPKAALLKAVLPKDALEPYEASQQSSIDPMGPVDSVQELIATMEQLNMLPDENVRVHTSWGSDGSGGGLSSPQEVECSSSIALECNRVSALSALAELLKLFSRELKVFSQCLGELSKLSKFILSTTSVMHAYGSASPEFCQKFYQAFVMPTPSSQHYKKDVAKIRNLQNFGADKQYSVYTVDSGSSEIHWVKSCHNCLKFRALGIEHKSSRKDNYSIITTHPQDHWYILTIIAIYTKNMNNRGKASKRTEAGDYVSGS
ncbi:hypothetical protein DFH29DRAFT_1066857 [Suillus ampliporus]|nr:hypothetical protein DFH29DRAFT_1066857 [Suillus ampliporus]